MHKAIVDGRIGRVTVAECVALLGRDRAYFARDAWRGTWQGEGGGALMNQAVHMIDMLLWMVGVPNEVYGRWATLKHGDYIDVEDSSCAVVAFDNGALATIIATTTLESIERAPGFRLAVHGAAGHTVGMNKSPELMQAVTDQWPFDTGRTGARLGELGGRQAGLSRLPCRSAPRLRARRARRPRADGDGSRRLSRARSHQGHLSLRGAAPAYSPADVGGRSRRGRPV